MTRDDVIHTVLQRMGRYDTLDSSLETILEDAFDTVCEEFPYLYEWWCVQAPLYSFSLSAGYSDYALPSTCAAVWSLRDSTNSYILQPCDIKEIERGQLQTGNAPTRYARWGDYLVVDPYPSATETSLPTMQIRFTTPMTQPSSGTATLETWSGKSLPAKFKELLIRGTKYYAYKTLEMEQEARIAAAEYVGEQYPLVLGGYAQFLKNGETGWQQFAWDAQVQVRTQ